MFTTNDTLYVRLLSGESPRATVVSNIVTIQLYRTEIYNVQIRTQLATEPSNTFLSMDQTTFTDRAIPPNEVQWISNEDALMVSNDTIPPALTSFVLNLEDDTMTFTFTEAVLLSSFVPDLLWISFDPRHSIEEAYNLGGGDVVVQSVFQALDTVYFWLTYEDAVFLEANTTIAFISYNTYLKNPFGGFITDTNDNSIGASPDIRVSVFIPDTTPPSVAAFDVDMDSAMLVLEFNDVILVPTFNGSAITLQSTVVSGESEIVTVDDSTFMSSSGRDISVQLSDELTNEIKRIRNLCSSSQNCYMTVTQFLISDPVDAPNNPIHDGSAIIVRNFSPDVTPPSLLAWTLDMNAGIIELNFSETVDITMFLYDQLTLQDMSQNNMYSLTSSVFLVSTPAAYVVIQLSERDLNEIKRLPFIGTSVNDSLLLIGDSAIADMNGNFISSSDGLPPASFIPDSTNPELVSFSLDIGLGILILTFSEIVVGASFNAFTISLVDGPVLQNISYTYTLTLAGGSSSIHDSIVIQFKLGLEDFFNINVTDDFATSVDNTYIAASSETITDTVGNFMHPITFANPLQASEICYFCSNVGKISTFTKTTGNNIKGTIVVP